MRKIPFVVVAVGAVAAVGAASVVERSGPCEVLAERDLFDVMMDFDASGGSPTLEEAVEDAFAEAGEPRQVGPVDLDPIIRAQPEGNLIHVGIDGYWVTLAIVQRGEGGAWGTALATEDGFVPVNGPRPCSILDRSTG
jgi:hypothetical protein